MPSVAGVEEVRKMAVPVELSAPDISAYKAGNTGLDYITTLDSGAPGPHVMVNAVTHGNELCGAIVVDFLFRQGVRPLRGKLSLGFANYQAFLGFDPARPTASRFVDEDFNRLWSPDVLDGPRDSRELRRAREMRPFIETVDFLLDLHSMQQDCPPLMLSGPLAKGQAFAARIGFPAHVVSDDGHAAGRRMRDYGAFGDDASPRNALLVECGQHWAADSAAVSLETTLRFLRALDMVDPEFTAAHLPNGAIPPQRFIEVTETVTVASDRFEFVGPFQGLEIIPKAGDLIGHDGGAPLRAPYDDCVLIMPSPRPRAGQTAVRLGRFV